MKFICSQYDHLVRVMSRDFCGHANFLCIFMILKSMVFKYMATLETGLYILCCSLKKKNLSTGRCNSVVECFSSVCKVLGSTPEQLI